MTHEALPQIPILRIAATYPTGGPGGAQLSFETYVAQDVPVREMHLMADKIEAVAQRQLYKGLIASKQNQIEANQRLLGEAQETLRKHQADLVDAQELHKQSGRHNMTALAGKRQEQIDVCDVNIKTLINNIKQLQADITALQSVIDDAVKE